MTDADFYTHFYFWLGLSFSILFFVLGIFSQDARAWVIGRYRGIKSRNDASYNAKVQKRIDLIVELSASQSKMLAFFFGQAFMLAVFFLVVFFFAVMLILKANALLPAVAFFIFWGWFLIVAAYPFDLATQLRNPERSIQRLKDQLR
jgi:hypothetical protein